MGLFSKKIASGVIVEEPGYCKAACVPVDDMVRATYFANHGQALPKDMTILALRDEKGHMIMETVKVKHEYSGEGLKYAIKRAKRYIRKMHKQGIPVTTRPPRHIALAMAAFSIADPDGFKGIMETV